MKMNRKTLTLATIALAGSLLAFATLPLLGWAAAIASPAVFAEWVRTSGSPELGVLLWTIAVDGFLGVGVAFVFAGLVALRFSLSSRAVTLSVLLLGFLVGSYFMVPAYFGNLALVMNAGLERSWWGYGIEIALVLSALAAAFLHSQMVRRRVGR